MLIHPWDAGRDDEWPQFLRENAFGLLTTLGRHDGWPVSVPTQFAVVPMDGGPASAGGPAGPRIRVDLHLARANPLFKALEEDDRATLVVAGDWAYIPTAWKAIGDEDPAMGVPTTYYAAVELRGRLEVVDDEPGLTAILRRQLAATQPDLPSADPSAHGRTLAGIRGLHLHVEVARAKFKYGGNVDDAHRAAIVAHLAERGGPGDRAATAHLNRRTPLPGS
jgi:transcriptional regulator